MKDVTRSNDEHPESLPDNNSIEEQVAPRSQRRRRRRQGNPDSDALGSIPSGTRVRYVAHADLMSIDKSRSRARDDIVRYLKQMRPSAPKICLDELSGFSVRLEQLLFDEAASREAYLELLDHMPFHLHQLCIDHQRLKLKMDGDPQIMALFGRLQVWRRRMVVLYNQLPWHILPLSTLAAIARVLPKCLAELRAVVQFKNLERRSKYEESIMACLHEFHSSGEPQPPEKPSCFRSDMNNPQFYHPSRRSYPIAGMTRKRKLPPSTSHIPNTSIRPHRRLSTVFPESTKVDARFPVVVSSGIQNPQERGMPATKVPPSYIMPSLMFRHPTSSLRRFDSCILPKPILPTGPEPELARPTPEMLQLQIALSHSRQEIERLQNALADTKHRTSS